MEATPPAPLEVPEADLLLEFLIIALDAPAQLGKADELSEADILLQRREPVFGRRGFALGPLDEQPFWHYEFWEQVRVGGTNPHAREARGEPIGRALAPADRAPSLFRQAQRELLDRDQVGLIAPPGVVDWFAAPARRGAGRPDQASRLNPSHIAHAKRGYAGAQARVAAVGRVHQRGADRNAGLPRRAQLFERDLRLRLERHRHGHVGLLAPRPVLRPVLRQIEPIGYRQAGVVIGDRQ